MGEVITFREVEIRYRTPSEGLKEVKSLEDVIRWMGEEIACANREHFLAIYTNARQQVIGYQTVAIGTATESIVSAREILQPAVALGAVGLIVAHNHPSGYCQPSEQDLRATQKLIEACDLLGLELYDSLVFAGDRGCSLLGTVRETSA